MENTAAGSRSFQFGLPGWRIFQHIKRGISVNWASAGAAAGSPLTPSPTPNIEMEELELTQNQHHNKSELVPEPEPDTGTGTDTDTDAATGSGPLESESSKIIPPVTDSALLKQHNIDQCIQIQLDRNQVSNLQKMKIQSQPKKQSKSTKSTIGIKASQDKNGRPTFKCSYLTCGHKSFQQESALHFHLATVHGEYPFKCDVCTEHKGYRSNKNLKRHALKRHSSAELSKMLRVCPFPRCKSTYYKFDLLYVMKHKHLEPHLLKLKPKPNPTLNMIKQSPSKATTVVPRKQNLMKRNYLKKYDLKSNLSKQHFKADLSKLKQGISTRTSIKRALQKQQKHRSSPNPLPGPGPKIKKHSFRIRDKTLQTKPKPIRLQNKIRHDVKTPLKKCFFPGCNFTGKPSSLWYHNIKYHVQEKRFHCHLCPHKTKLKQSLQLHLKHRHGKTVKSSEISNVSYSFTAKSCAEQVSERKLLQRYNITQNVQVKLDKIGKKMPSTSISKRGKRSRSRIPTSRSKNPNPTTSKSKSTSMQSFQQIRKQFRPTMTEWNKKRAQQNSFENTIIKIRRGRGRPPKSAQNNTIIYNGNEGFKNNLNRRQKHLYRNNQLVPRRRPGRPPKVKTNETVVKNRLFQNTYDRPVETMNLIKISNLNFANCDLFKIQSLQQLPSSSNSHHSDSCINLIDIRNSSNISSNTSQLKSKNNVSSNFHMGPPKQKMLEQESNGNLNSSLLTSYNQDQQHLCRALQNSNDIFFKNSLGGNGNQIRQRKRNLRVLKESPSSFTTTTNTTSLNLKLAQNDLKKSGVCTLTDFASISSSSSSSGSSSENGLQNLENFDAYEIVARRIDPDGSVTYQVVWREPVQNWTEELILGQPEPQKHLMDFDFHFDGEIEFGIGIGMK